MGLTNTVVKLSEFNEENHKAKEPTHHNRKNGVHHVILRTTTIPSQNAPTHTRTHTQYEVQCESSKEPHTTLQGDTEHGGRDPTCHNRDAATLAMTSVSETNPSCWLTFELVLALH
jgi:hypothetical protein